MKLKTPALELSGQNSLSLDTKEELYFLLYISEI